MKYLVYISAILLIVTTGLSVRGSDSLTKEVEDVSGRQNGPSVQDRIKRWGQGSTSDGSGSTLSTPSPKSVKAQSDELGNDKDEIPSDVTESSSSTHSTYSSGSSSPSTTTIPSTPSPQKDLLKELAVNIQSTNLPYFLDRLQPHNFNLQKIRNAAHLIRDDDVRNYVQTQYNIALPAVSQFPVISALVNFANLKQEYPGLVSKNKKLGLKARRDSVSKKERNPLNKSQRKRRKGMIQNVIDQIQTGFHFYGIKMEHIGLIPPLGEWPEANLTALGMPAEDSESEDNGEKKITPHTVVTTQTSEQKHKFLDLTKPCGISLEAVKQELKKKTDNDLYNLAKSIQNLKLLLSSIPKETLNALIAIAEKEEFLETLHETLQRGMEKQNKKTVKASIGQVRKELDSLKKQLPQTHTGKTVGDLRSSNPLYVEVQDILSKFGKDCVITRSQLYKLGCVEWPVEETF